MDPVSVNKKLAMILKQNIDAYCLVQNKAK